MEQETATLSRWRSILSLSDGMRQFAGRFRWFERRRRGFERRAGVRLWEKWRNMDRMEFKWRRESHTEVFF